MCPGKPGPQSGSPLKRGENNLPKGRDRSPLERGRLLAAGVCDWNGRESVGHTPPLCVCARASPGRKVGPLSRGEKTTSPRGGIGPLLRGAGCSQPGCVIGTGGNLWDTPHHFAYVPGQARAAKWVPSQEGRKQPPQGAG